MSRAILRALFTRPTLFETAQTDLKNCEADLYRALNQQEDALHTVSYLRARVLRLEQFVANTGKEPGLFKLQERKDSK